jgi:hypothetical protein
MDKCIKITTPGLALRTGPFEPGISFGWFETTLIYPTTPGGTNSHVRPVAIQTKCVGVDLSLVHIMFLEYLIKQERTELESHVVDPQAFKMTYGEVFPSIIVPAREQIDAVLESYTSQP